VSGLISAIGHVLRVGLIGWGALAIFYSNLPWPAFRVVLSLVFAAFGIWSLWFARQAGSWMVFAAVFVAVLVWWISIPPSHDRLWRPEVAVMPRALIEGDRVRISNFRNFDYRAVDDFTPRYEAREVSLSHLTGVDFYVSYWMPGPIGHTFVSFVFDNAPPVSISIEARPEAGEGYAPIASLFKQFELIYVVGDERDIVRVRTNYRGEDVYLYHVKIDRQNARRLFELYLERINELADHPEFYHLLSNSCTVNIVRYAQSIAGGGRFDIRHYLNGLFDAYLYDLGRLDTTLSFDELRSHSHINDAARSAGDGAEFPELIRSSLPSVHP
jgi:hypothetical protein